VKGAYEGQGKLTFLEGHCDDLFLDLLAAEARFAGIELNEGPSRRWTSQFRGGKSAYLLVRIE
jgi:hypothetical protein